MHFKHLKLQGYKSFATKTEFLFPTGVTAIVGPNGSGKSNIADAIRWALGERSMRSLRAKSTADMIFAGGQGRARTGMAEVALTFDNSDGALPIEFSEVTITRRAYRSGENEYLINGARVLLRDINELLAVCGLGERTYTVIGQGLVDAALSLQPQERRTLFEEAAGISLYRDRREKAVERLDETEHNLERARDIISEVAPRLQKLEEEVQRVEEHRRLSVHLERLQRTWYGYQWGQQQGALARVLERAANLEASREARKREASALSERLVQLRQQESELRIRLRDWYRESADIHDMVDAAQRELAVAEERERLLKVRRKELLAEIEPLRTQEEEQAKQIAEVQVQVEKLARELAERKRRLGDVERRWMTVQAQAEEPDRQRARVEQELRAHRARLERLNQALLEAREETSRLAGEQAVAEERARQLAARRQETLTELEPLGEREALQSEQVDQARAQVEELERELAGRQEGLAELEREWEARCDLSIVQTDAPLPSPEWLQAEQVLQAHRERVEHLEQQLRDVRAEEARLRGELEALDGMRAARAAYDKGAQALFQAGLDGVVSEGTLATLIQSPPEWERAIEAALGGDLQAIVVERASIVEEAQRIVESAGGRLTLLPLDELRPPPSLPAGALRAADVVSCDDFARLAVEAILGAAALCDDLSAAQALLPAMPPGSRCVTAGGLVLRADGALLVGQAGSGGVLAGERARRELPAQLEAVRQRCQRMEEERRTEAVQVAALETQLEELNRQAAAAREKQSRAFQEKLGQIRTEVAVARETLRSQQVALQHEEAALEQLHSQRSVLRAQANKLEAEHADAVKRVRVLHATVSRLDAQFDSDVQAQLATDEWIDQGFQTQFEEARGRGWEIERRQRVEAERIAALEAELERLTRQITETREEAARIEREELGEARTEAAVAEEVLRSRRDALGRETTLLERLRAQIDARLRRTEELEAEHAAIVARIEELRRDASRLEEQLREARTHIQPAEEELETLGQEQTALEEQARWAQDRVRDADARSGRAQLEVERCQDELRLLGQRIEEDLGLVELELANGVTAQTPLPIRPLVSELPVVEELPEGLEQEMQLLKTRLRRLGAINPNAPDEYAEVRERHDFLTEQSADLEAASAKLRQTVAELDELMEAAFRETFEAVATKFSEMFTTLFNGGAARLELTDPDDLMNTGIDIVARPPGKRGQRLALLSGGERALTASALLFALLHVSPTPFCVFDEVDAMLDEANTGRFRMLLEELSQQTQFIVITHNRVTVEVADTIYGVSMGADAVSQVVSLKMD
jgi:chromosome segregation protein